MVSVKHRTHPVFKDIGETGPSHEKFYIQEVRSEIERLQRDLEAQKRGI